MAEEGFLAGVPVGIEGGVVRDEGDALLIAVTEKRTKDEIDAFVSALEKVVR
jgi:glycine cleavage system pyridoxal-binding protein P